MFVCLFVCSAKLQSLACQTRLKVTESLRTLPLVPRTLVALPTSGRQAALFVKNSQTVYTPSDLV